MRDLLDNPEQLVTVYSYWGRFHAWAFLAPWGAFLALMESYDSSPTYDVMASIAPELVMGGFFCVAGLVLGALARPARQRMMLVAFGLGACTCAIFLFFLWGNARSTGALTYGVMTLGDLLALGHLYSLKWPLAALARAREVSDADV